MFPDSLSNLRVKSLKEKYENKKKITKIDVFKEYFETQWFNLILRLGYSEMDKSGMKGFFYGWLPARRRAQKNM